MNHTLEKSPLAETTATQARMERWIAAQHRGDALDLDIYEKPSEKQLKELENVRSLSKELQDHLNELERSVRIAEVEDEAMTPTAPILDFSENHEFMSVDTELIDGAEAREEEKQRLMKESKITMVSAKSSSHGVFYFNNPMAESA